MNDNVYKIIELTGTSTNSSDEAVQNAITRAAKTIRQMRWFEVVETRGSLENGRVSQWQVTVKVGFTMEE